MANYTEVEYKEGMQLEEGDELVDVMPEYDEDLYKRLNLNPPAAKKIVRKKVKDDDSSKEDKKDEPNNQIQKEKDIEEFDDEKFLEAYNKRFKTNFKDIKEISQAIETKESEEEKAKRLKKEKLQFGITNNIIDADVLTEYNRDSGKKPEELVFEEFAKKYPNKNEDEIRALWDKRYKVDEDDPNYKDLMTEIQEEMKKKSEEILKKRYPQIYELDEKYNSYLSETQRVREVESKIIQQAKQYKDDLEEIISNFNRKEVLSIGHKDSNEQEEIDFEYPEDVIQEIKKKFMDASVLSKFISEYDKASLKKAVEDAIQLAVMPQRISHFATSYAKKRLDKHRSGRKNMTPDGVSSVEATDRVDDWMREYIDPKFI